MFCMIKSGEAMFDYRKHCFKNTLSGATIIRYDTTMLLPRFNKINKALAKGLCRPTRFYTMQFVFLLGFVGHFFFHFQFTTS